MSQNNLASLWSRVGAAVIDLIIVFIGTALVLFSWVVILGLQQAPADHKLIWEARGFFVGLLVDLAYTVALMAGSKQSTYGQRALGIRVSKLDGSDVRFGSALGRYLVSLVSSVILKLGFFIAVFTKHKQTLHDLAAGTIVVYDLEPQPRLLLERKLSVDRGDCPSVESKVDTPFNYKVQDRNIYSQSMEYAYAKAQSNDEKSDQSVKENAMGLKPSAGSMEEAYSYLSPDTTRPEAPSYMPTKTTPATAGKVTIDEDRIYSQVVTTSDEEAIYEQALTELSTNKKPGLWAMALAQTANGGNPDGAYIALRVEQLRGGRSEQKQLREDDDAAMARDSRVLVKP